MPCRVPHTNASSKARSSSFDKSCVHAQIADVDVRFRTQYIIQVADLQKPSKRWRVLRRYSEFRALRHDLRHLSSLCSTCAFLLQDPGVLKFPRRSLIKASSFMDTRKLRLNRFLQQTVHYSRTCNVVDCPLTSLLSTFLAVPTLRFSETNRCSKDLFSRDSSPQLSSPHINSMHPFPNTRQYSLAKTPHRGTVPMHHRVKSKNIFLQPIREEKLE